jgi:hypothetical protein
MGSILKGLKVEIMLEQVNQPVDVACKFTGNNLIPLKFLWQGREYFIKKINLTYSSWEGRVKFYYFAVSDSTNYFKLQFNTDNLKWTLLESYVD